MFPYQNYGYQPNYQAPNYMQRGYAPQGAQMPQMPQQPQPPIQTPMPMETPIQDIKFVNRAQAEAYIVFPNTKVLLIDKDNGAVYVKTADNMGQTQTEYYRFEPTNADGSPIKAQEPTPEVNFDEFVRKDQLAKLGFVTAEQFETLSKKIEQIQRQIVGGKPNVATKQP
jgi:hypothetical protein